MSEDSFSATFAALTTATEQDQTMVRNTITLSSSRRAFFYYQYMVLVIGIVGTAANALILYAMVASKEHKKQLLIFNQNVFDLCSCLLLVITYTVRVCNIYLTGTLGYWLCMLITSENLLWGSITGSTINLMIVTIERYIKVVHSSWSKKLLHEWVKCAAAAFAWISGTVYMMVLVFPTSAVIDGVCIAYLIWKSKMAALIHGIWSFTSFYIIVIFIFVYCYGKILVVICHQARVMAVHSGPGGSTSQHTQSGHIQSNVIKTMIFVSGFYVILWTPLHIYYLVLQININLVTGDIAYYVGLLLVFLYISANPFIYAVKFNPVRHVLVGLIPWKRSQQAGESIQMPTPGTATARTTTQHN